MQQASTWPIISGEEGIARLPVSHLHSADATTNCSNKSVPVEKPAAGPVDRAGPVEGARPVDGTVAVVAEQAAARVTEVSLSARVKCSNLHQPQVNVVNAATAHPLRLAGHGEDCALRARLVATIDCKCDNHAGGQCQQKDLVITGHGLAIESPVDISQVRPGEAAGGAPPEHGTAGHDRAVADQQDDVRLSVKINDMRVVDCDARATDAELESKHKSKHKQKTAESTQVVTSQERTVELRNEEYSAQKHKRMDSGMAPLIESPRLSELDSKMPNPDVQPTNKGTTENLPGNMTIISEDIKQEFNKFGDKSQMTAEWKHDAQPGKPTEQGITFDNRTLHISQEAMLSLPTIPPRGMRPFKSGSNEMQRSQSPVEQNARFGGGSTEPPRTEPELNWQSQMSAGKGPHLSGTDMTDGKRRASTLTLNRPIITDRTHDSLSEHSDMNIYRSEASATSHEQSSFDVIIYPHSKIKPLIYNAQVSTPNLEPNYQKMLSSHRLSTGEIVIEGWEDGTIKITTQGLQVPEMQDDSSKQGNQLNMASQVETENFVPTERQGSSTSRISHRSQRSVNDEQRSFAPVVHILDGNTKISIIHPVYPEGADSSIYKLAKNDEAHQVPINTGHPQPFGEDTLNIDVDDSIDENIFSLQHDEISPTNDDIAGSAPTTVHSSESEQIKVSRNETDGISVSEINQKTNMIAASKNKQSGEALLHAKADSDARSAKPNMDNRNVGVPGAPASTPADRAPKNKPGRTTRTTVSNVSIVKQSADLENDDRRLRFSSVQPRSDSKTITMRHSSTRQDNMPPTKSSSLTASLNRQRASSRASQQELASIAHPSLDDISITISRQTRSPDGSIGYDGRGTCRNTTRDNFSQLHNHHRSYRNSAAQSEQFNTRQNDLMLGNSYNTRACDQYTCNPPDASYYPPALSRCSTSCVDNCVSPNPGCPSVASVLLQPIHVHHSCSGQPSVCSPANFCLQPSPSTCSDGFVSRGPCRQCVPGNARGVIESRCPHELNYYREFNPPTRSTFSQLPAESFRQQACESDDDCDGYCVHRRVTANYVAGPGPPHDPRSSAGWQ